MIKPHDMIPVAIDKKDISRLEGRSEGVAGTYPSAEQGHVLHVPGREGAPNSWYKKQNKKVYVSVCLSTER